MNTLLIAPVTAQEIKQAAFNIKGDSAPGADGWTGAFFQRYWSIVGSDIIKEGAFVAGRLISDNILIAHEIVHALQTNAKFNESFLAIMTDMSKAYDRVEWEFLEHLFCKMGFHGQWIQWIMMSQLQGRLTGFSFNNLYPVVQHLLFADDSLLISRATKEECEEIIRCLQLYGKASGQLINFSKSAVTFGKKTTDEVKQIVKQTLNILEEGGSGTYLGLPECFRGSKQALLGFIGDKLQNRLQGWFANSLSLGGKEVLLKAVVMALPVFAMSYVRLSKNLCRMLTSAMCELWWSNCQGKRKIAWVAWKKLCKSKSEGGLGFKDLGDFNQALLAKQAWRILNTPDSLLARFYKSRYFRKSTILDCGKCTRPSYAWRSIIHGRELLKQGLLKNIGDGHDTSVWLDKWIFDKHPRAPYRFQTIFQVNLRVSDLRVTNQPQWDREKVQYLFPPGDASQILAMPLKVGSRDRYIWPYTKSGSYSVKSGYWLKQTLPTLYEPRDDVLAKRNELKAHVWKLKTVPKIKSFLWRMLSGALAVTEHLASRGQAFAMANIPSPSGGFSPVYVDQNWEHLWSVMQDDTIPGEEKSLQWNAVQALPSYAEQPKCVQQGKLEVKWCKPPMGFIKCNVGSSWRNSSCLSSGAWIVRDYQGQVLYHARHALTASESRFLATLRTFLWAIEALLILQTPKVEFVIDNALVIEAVNNPTGCPRFHLVLNEILMALSKFSAWRCYSAASSANKVAMAIASSVTRDGRFKSYLSLGGPSWLHDQVRSEGL
ncbi:PREDICTED: uncharacterized protein LOC104748491 [Camelina sativa]|uniref:Uncharacterized protein LOC104748491 n=1 Tax=Camelina sativa TaxID=90675 RepID=A0ABM0WB46_CAMSA|nr:PREDICTED: uncharacterized protein LOC104748491 [Camelina sativa]